MSISRQACRAFAGVSRSTGDLRDQHADAECTILRIKLIE